MNHSCPTRRVSGVAERLDERDGEEHGAGDEGGHRHRDPHLLSASFDLLDELALHLAPDAARLVSDEPAEVAGLAVPGEDGDEARERIDVRSEEHTSELQYLMRNSYAVFCLQ